MWLAVLAFGAVLVHRARLPGWLAPYLSAPPPPEAKYALYFLAAALLRLVVRNARVAALERKGRREARRAAKAAERPALVDVGAGLGRGVAEVLVGADVLGAAVATLAAALRLALRSTRLDAAELAARARERKRRVAREHRRAAGCIVAVGTLCAVLAWAPLWAARIPPGVASGLGQVAQALPDLRAFRAGR